MDDEATTLGDHSDLSEGLLHDLEAFVDEAGRRNATAHLDAVTSDGKYLKGTQLNQRPERFIEDHLIFPVLETLGHAYRPRPMGYAPRWTHDTGIPDFCLEMVPIETAKECDLRLFGESKPLNKLHYARDDAKMYFNQDIDTHAVAILTTGIEWEIRGRPRNAETSDGAPLLASGSLEEPLRRIKVRNHESGSYSRHAVRQAIEVDSFQRMRPQHLRSIVEEEFGITVSTDQDPSR